MKRSPLENPLARPKRGLNPDGVEMIRLTLGEDEGKAFAATFDKPQASDSSETAEKWDDFEMSAEDLKAVEMKEKGWGWRQLIDWAETAGQDEDWARKNFEIHADGTIECGLKVLDLSNTQVTTIPDHLQVKELYFSNTQVSTIPDNLQVEYLYLNYTQVTTIPAGIAIKQLFLNADQTELKASAEALGIEVVEYYAKHL